MRTTVEGDKTALRRNYLAADFRADHGRLGVVKAVHVEAMAADPLAESRRCQATADRDGLPQAIVARVALDGPQVEREPSPAAPGRVGPAPGRRCPDPR